MTTLPELLDTLVREANAPMALTDARGALLAKSLGWQPMHDEVRFLHRAALADPAGPMALALSDPLGKRPVHLACLRLEPPVPDGPACLLIGHDDDAVSPRERFLGIIEALPFAVGVHRDFTFVHVNRRAAEYLGYESPDDLIGKPIISIIPPHEVATIRERIALLMETGGPTPERATQVQRADGTLVTAELSSFAMQDSDGLPSYVVVARDVTERQVYERRLQQVQRMEAVGRLAGGIAHDFNNVLSVILSYAAVLTDTLDRDSPAGIAAAEIRQAAIRATGMTRRLLTISSGRNEQVNGEAPTLVAPIVDELLSLLRRLCGKEVNLSVRGSDPSLCVRTGPSPLEQILLNLVINARDAARPGGQIEIRLGETAIAPRKSPKTVGPFVTIAVADDGVGMSEAVRERAFEPFFSTKGPSEGTGLGLSTVFGIARQAGGGACIDSAPGAGTVVTVWLPACLEEDRPAMRPPAEPPTEPASEQRARLWVVEDDLPIRVMVARLLKHAGHSVQAFASGEEALEALDAEGEDPPPDLLVTDVIMDGCQGPELALAVRARLPRLPVLFMSGYTEDTLDARHLTGGPTRFLGKPFTPRDLLDTVQALLVSRVGC